MSWVLDGTHNEMEREFRDAAKKERRSRIGFLLYFCTLRARAEFSAGDEGGAKASSDIRSLVILSDVPSQCLQ